MTLCISHVYMLMYVHMHLCVVVSRYMCVPAHVCTCQWRLKEDSVVPSQLPFILFLTQGLLLAFSFPSRLGGLVAEYWETTSVYMLRAEIINACQHSQSFYMGSGYGTQVVMLFTDEPQP